MFAHYETLQELIEAKESLMYLIGTEGNQTIDKQIEDLLSSQ